MIWREHPALRKEFWKKQISWSDGYFCTSIGKALVETVKQYIENQGQGETLFMKGSHSSHWRYTTKWVFWPQEL